MLAITLVNFQERSKSNGQVWENGLSQMLWQFEWHCKVLTIGAAWMVQKRCGPWSIPNAASPCAPVHNYCSVLIPMISCCDCPSQNDN